MFKRILLAVDIAEPGLTAPAKAAVCEMATAAGAAVRLIHVRYMIDAALAYLPGDFFEQEERRIHAELERMAAGMKLPAETVSVVCPLGTVYDRVLAEAVSFAADLIVVGSHRPSMSSYLIGSNAARIVRHAQCSVLVVR